MNTGKMYLRNALTELLNMKKVLLGIIFIALGLIVPQIFHIIGGPQTGVSFSPMHIPVLLAGLLMGPITGLYVGGLTPIISFLINGMPPIPIMDFMAVELGVYGFCAGLLYKKYKLNIFISLLSTMLFGRMVYVAVFGLMMNASFIQVIKSSVFTTLPGIILQIILIPVLMVLLKQIKGFKSLD